MPFRGRRSYLCFLTDKNELSISHQPGHVAWPRQTPHLTERPHCGALPVAGAVPPPRTHRPTDRAVLSPEPHRLAVAAVHTLAGARRRLAAVAHRLAAGVGHRLAGAEHRLVERPA